MDCAATLEHMAEQPNVRNEISGTVIGNVIQGRDVTVSLPAIPVAVSGLPAQPVFVGRDVELTRLTNVLQPDAADTLNAPGVVSVVAGLAGVGKTTLAVRAAHDAITTGWFPGGVLMVDLRGYDPPERRVQPTAALTSLLGALGTRNEHIPPDQADRERLWRSLLAKRHAPGQRTLILLDNASSTEQVRPLLPGPGGHRVMITSRHSLADLGGARLFDVDVMSATHATTLLQLELAAAHPDDNRIHPDPTAADKLARLCGGLPLAIRIAAAVLAAEPDRPLSELIEALLTERHRLEELTYDGNLNVRAAFDLSYQHLTGRQARLHRLIGLNPGPEISTEAAAALIGADATDTRRLISQLRRAHLVQPGVHRGGWRMHDLLRLYAAERAEEDEEREPALDRLFRHYLTTSETMSRHLDSHAKANDDTRFTNRQDALTWFDTEYSNLNAALNLAYNTGRYAQSVTLADTLYNFFSLHLNLQTHDWISTHQIALIAARKIEDRAAEGRIHDRLGIAFMRSSLDTEAAHHSQQALDIYRELNNCHGAARAMLTLGWANTGHDKDEDAARWFRQALAICREVGDRRGQARALHGLQITCQLEEAVDCHYQAREIYRELGEPEREPAEILQIGGCYAKHGRWAESVSYYRQALDMWQDLKDSGYQVHHVDVLERTYEEAQTLRYLGESYHKLDRVDQAIICYQQSARMQRELGNTNGEAHALANLGDAYRDTGRPDAAAACWAEALDLFAELHSADARADQLRAALDTEPTP